MQLRSGTTARREQRGITLLEVLIALGILGVIGVVFMAALASVFRAQDLNREQVRAQNLARATLEDIRNQPYLDSYTVSVPVPFQYSVTIDTQPYCYPEPCVSANNIQKTTVKLSRGGKPLLFIEDLKTRR